MLGKEVTLERESLRFTAWVNDQGAGDWVVLLHGFPDSPFTWETQIPALVAAGFRTLVVTSRGYETSSLSTTDDYQLTTLADDFPAWLDSLGIQRAHFVGHDWGASIGYAVAVRHPHRILSLSCLAVPHPARLGEAFAAKPAQLWRSRYMIGFQLKGLAEWRIRRRNFAYIDKLWRRWSPSWDVPAALLKRSKQHLTQAGVLEALLGYYRQGADTRSDAGKASRELTQQIVPVRTLGLYGREDGCIAGDIFAGAMQENDFPSGLRVHAIEAAGHFLHLEQPELVNKHLIEWLGRKGKAA